MIFIMRRALATCAGLLLASTDVPGQAPTRTVAITFDDLPMVSYRPAGINEQLAITGKLLGGVKRHGIPAIGFVNERKLLRDDAIDPEKVVGSSRVDLQACKLEYSIVSPK